MITVHPVQEHWSDLILKLALLYFKFLDTFLNPTIRYVWKRGCSYIFKIFKFLFLLKFNMIYMFWIVLMR
jgi:hypothetical protein